MKKRRILWISVVAALVVLLAAGGYFLLRPRPLFDAEHDKLELAWVKSGDQQEEYTDRIDEQALTELLSQAEVSLMLDSPFPYAADQVAFEIYYHCNNKPLFLLLGEINIAYESSDKPVYRIQNPGALLEAVERMLS